MRYTALESSMALTRVLLSKCAVDSVVMVYIVNIDKYNILSIPDALIVIILYFSESDALINYHMLYLII